MKHQFNTLRSLIHIICRHLLFKMNFRICFQCSKMLFFFTYSNFFFLIKFCHFLQISTKFVHLLVFYNFCYYKWELFPIVSNWTLLINIKATGFVHLFCNRFTSHISSCSFPIDSTVFLRQIIMSSANNDRLSFSIQYLHLFLSLIVSAPPSRTLLLPNNRGWQLIMFV